MLKIYLIDILSKHCMSPNRRVIMKSVKSNSHMFDIFRTWLSVKWDVFILVMHGISRLYRNSVMEKFAKWHRQVNFFVTFHRTAATPTNFLDTVEILFCFIGKIKRDIVNEQVSYIIRATITRSRRVSFVNQFPRDFSLVALEIIFSHVFSWIDNS